MKVREIDGETQGDLSPIFHCESCSCCSSSLALNPGVPLGWQGPKALRHHLLPSKVCISRNLGLEAEPGLKPRHLDMGYRVPSSILTGVPTQAFIFLTFQGAVRLPCRGERTNCFKKQMSVQEVDKKRRRFLLGPCDVRGEKILDNAGNRQKRRGFGELARRAARKRTEGEDRQKHQGHQTEALKQEVRIKESIKTAHTRLVVLPYLQTALHMVAYLILTSIMLSPYYGHSAVSKTLGNSASHYCHI